MLVLSRKSNESVVIGNTTRVTVIEIGHGVVKLGFQAPADVSIYREELHEQIASFNRGAVAQGEQPTSPPRKDRKRNRRK